MTACSAKMQILNRWGKFNAVGALGFCVQLSALYIFVEACGIAPLLATALAVETAILHNFTWHHFFTWRDRHLRKWRGAFLRLLAFNGMNGFVSLAVNVFFVWLIVPRRSSSLLVANLVAIAVCSCINFILSDKLVFRIAAKRDHLDRGDCAHQVPVLP